MQLKEWLEKEKMTKGDLAKALKVPYHKIHYISRPFSHITLAFAFEIVEYTKGEVTFEDLLKMNEADTN